VARFPDSRYAPDARARMTYIVNSLAQYEVHVARYYFNRGAYVAAINRAQAALADYQDVPALEEALYILHRSYEALGMTQLAGDTRRVMKRTSAERLLSGGLKGRRTPGEVLVIGGARRLGQGVEFLVEASGDTSMRMGGKAA
jgi:outer membrane protein assembly factor BamD